MVCLHKFWTLLGYITPFQAALGTSLVLLYFVYLYLKQNELPPGPIGLPFFGYWPFLNLGICHVQMRDLARKYGDVLSFTAFGNLFVQLGSIKAIKEAHITKGDCFESRYTSFGIITYFFQDGVSLLNGEPWKILRKFFLQKFKEYGMSGVKDNNSGAIQNSLQQCIDELYKSKGQPIAITDLATKKCLSIVRTFMFKDKGISTEQLQSLNDEFLVIMRGMQSHMLLVMGNFARFFFFPFIPHYWKMKKSLNCINSTLLDIISRHKRGYDDFQTANIIDCYIKEKNDREKKGDPTAKYFTDKALASSLNQFVTDGVMTIGIFIGMFLLKLVEFPEEQEKIYREIMDVVGPERLPIIDDKNKLPYTNAFMYEVMRLSEFFPIFPSLECSKETEVQGMKIPKGSILVINFFAAQRNPNTYDDPETFYPGRYLSTPGKPKPELPVLFGVGKRSCIGEGFTMIQTFLFFTAIVQKFRLEVPESEKGVPITFWSQEKIKICAIPRS